MGTRASRRAAVVAIAAIIGLVGCGGSDDGDNDDTATTEDSGPSDGSTTSTTSGDDGADDLTPTDLDPCVLLTKADVAEVTGAAVGDGTTQEMGSTKSCAYVGTGLRGASALVQLVPVPDDSWKGTQQPNCQAEDAEVSGVEAALVSCAETSQVTALAKVRGVVVGTVASGGLDGAVAIDKVEDEARELLALIIGRVNDT